MFGSDLRNLHRGGELWEKIRSKSLVVEYFNSSEIA